MGEFDKQYEIAGDIGWAGDQVMNSEQARDIEQWEGRCCTTLALEDSYREPMRLNGWHE